MHINFGGYGLSGFGDFAPFRSLLGHVVMLVLCVWVYALCCIQLCSM